MELKYNMVKNTSKKKFKNVLMKNIMYIQYGKTLIQIKSLFHRRESRQLHVPVIF